MGSKKNGNITNLGEKGGVIIVKYFQYLRLVFFIVSINLINKTNVDKLEKKGGICFFIYEFVLKVWLLPQRSENLSHIK